MPEEDENATQEGSEQSPEDEAQNEEEDDGEEEVSAADMFAEMNS